MEIRNYSHFKPFWPLDERDLCDFPRRRKIPPRTNRQLSPPVHTSVPFKRAPTHKPWQHLVRNFSSFPSPSPRPPSPIDAVHRILRGRAARLIIGSLKNPASGLIHGTNAFYYKGGRTISLEENNWNWMPDLRAWEELARRFSRVVIIWRW